jgi:hypothetical protein
VKISRESLITYAYLKRVDDVHFSLLIDHHSFSIATASRVIICSVFIAHLSSALSSAILPSLDESRIPVDSNDSIVQACAVDVAHRCFRVLASVVFDKAESTRSLKWHEKIKCIFPICNCDKLTFLNLSKPITIRLTSPQREKSSWICSSVV